MTQPKGKLVLVKPDAVSETYESGLLKTTRRLSDIGEVLAISLDYEIPLKVGDRVKYLTTHQEVVEEGVLVRGDIDGAILLKFNET